MTVEALPDAGAFLAATASLRDRHPATTNLLGSVAAGVVAGRRYPSARWWVARDGVGAVVGAAMHTAPWPPVMSPMPDVAAAALADAVAATEPEVPGLVAPDDVAAVVLARWARAEASRTVELVMVLDLLVPPVGVPGAARVAVDAEIDRLVDWNRQFAVDAGMPGHDGAEELRWRIAQGSLWWWTVDDEPVAMAGHAPPVDTPAGTVARIGPVYTPAAQRGRGYGGAVTAALAAHLQRTGATVMLHADAANATSVGLYTRLGFATVGRLLDVRFR